MKSKYYRLSKGAGLVEVLISLLIISFSTFGLVTLQTQILRGSQLVRDRLEALYLAESTLERFHIETVKISTGDLEYIKNGRYIVETKFISSDSIDGLYHVEVNVSWKGGISTVHKVTLASAIYAEGV